ncbi:3-phosphoglycerate dehydrogenase family protein [Marichromatium gracile]|uniref:3-phosphoglycerate dehydrogenase family protein n=1 Tax=Marichromatium gracile TaxID=1048 RepID=UPI001F381B4F|nr:3-phosphoglycerate dehydrogenase family protein [Marichromatium gracile]MCF1181842.1 3-phosphoglycerate dehydrogenase family protein [Marichromatium gracile]
MFRIQTLNQIAVAGLERLPREHYEVASEIVHPDAILLRSAPLQAAAVPSSVRAVGRAGAGTNNIPVAALTARGVAVFNTPGANANAVKELVLAALLIGSRNIAQALRFVEGLDGDDAAIQQAVEQGKRAFVGFELPGRTLGVIGLGAIGVKVANAARALGMRVIGYDPTITVARAWQLEHDVEAAHSVDEVLARADCVTLHVPLTEDTRHLIDATRLRGMRHGALLLNFSRRGIVDDAAVLAALDEGRLHGYCCDFPNNQLKAHPQVVVLPHLGASTREAEDNCAVMVAEQLRDYLENGNVTHSVNFPEIVLPRNGGARISIVNNNVPNMVGQISTHLGTAGLNILDMLNRSRETIAVTLIDVDRCCPPETLAALAAIDGVCSARALDPLPEAC